MPSSPRSASANRARAGWLAVGWLSATLAGCATPGEKTPPSVTAPVGHALVYRCGDRRIAVRLADGYADLHERPNGTVTLQRSTTASGIGYARSGTVFRTRGASVLLIDASRRYTCERVPAEQPSLKATGNEPFWALRVEARRLVLERPDSDPRVFARPRLEPIAAGYRYRLPAGGEVDILARPCRDSMSGMPHPLTVEIRLDGAGYRGCGGAPRALLTGGEWVVEAGDTAGPTPTLAFSADGTVTGDTGCNRFRGGYSLSGEGLTIGHLVSTRRACPGDRAVAERRFLETLQRVRRFRIAEDGALVLVARDGARLTARR